MRQEILRRHRVNALNVSIRQAMPDTGTLLRWAPRETFAVVLYHKQRTRDNARSRVGVWTRELIDAALEVGGTYYLPYQPHATVEQFHRAYPRARDFFALKWEIDPNFRFTNVLWDKYYRAWLDRSRPAAAVEHPSEFHRVFADVGLSDAFYRFLQTVFRTVPEDRFHHLIGEACRRHRDEEAVYRHVQQELKGIKPFLADLRYTLPSLGRQKQEMVAQTLTVLGSRRRFEGYVEIGSKARYYAGLAKQLDLAGPAWFIDERPPGLSAADILERGSMSPQGQHVPLQDYAPIVPAAIGDACVDLVACYVGLHHVTAERLAPFLASVARILRPGGLFIVRDHDVDSDEMRALVSLAHTVFNAGLGETWESNRAELRCFEPAETWVRRLHDAGFDDRGHRVLQEHDPTRNALFCFERRGAGQAATASREAAVFA